MTTHFQQLDAPMPADAFSPALVEGEVVRTATGRITTPFPRVDFKTERKAQNTLLRVDAWLVENATREAFARGNDTRSRVMAQYRPGRLSLADKDECCLCLFDVELAALEREHAHLRARLSQPEASEPFKAEGQTIWLLNYTTQPGVGHTTMIKAFSKLELATAFAKESGAHGYLLKLWDIGTFAPPHQRAITRFETWIGEFNPSDQEVARLEAAVELPIESMAS